MMEQTLKTQPLKTLSRTLLAGMVALGLTACEDATGPAGSGTAQVTLGQMAGSASNAIAGSMTRQTGFAPATVDAVESIVVRVNRVQVHRAGMDEGATEGEENEEAGPAWVDLSVEEVEVDLMGDLSAGQEIVLAEGELTPGSYDQVRLFVDSAAITFTEPQPVPGSPSDSVTTAQLRIPSAGQTGIKVPGAGFEIEDGALTTVTVLFDTGTSVQNISIAGTGEVIMSPVLVGENAEQVSEQTN